MTTNPEDIPVVDSFEILEREDAIAPLMRGVTRRLAEHIEASLKARPFGVTKYQIKEGHDANVIANTLRKMLRDRGITISVQDGAIFAWNEAAEEVSA